MINDWHCFAKEGTESHHCQTFSATKHLRLDWCDPGRRRCKLIVIDDDVHSLMAAWWQPDSSRALAWQWLFSFFTTVIIALIITKSNTITKIGASYPKFGQTKTWDRIGWIRGKAGYSLRNAINFEQRILRLWGTFSPLRNLAQWKETDRILERVATAWEQRLRRFPPLEAHSRHPRSPPSTSQTVYCAHFK